MLEQKKLPYAMNALEPYISAKTVEFHYTKHHFGYVDKANSLIKDTKYENASVATIIKETEGAIFNNVAQAINHEFYWESLTPNSSKQPLKATAELINKNWGTFENFKNEFKNSAITLFGSGWTWLVIDENKNMKLLNTFNAGTPLTTSTKALLVCDVWEHAYYLDYQNLRAKHVDNFWEIINWEKVEERLTK